jgi:hypothetical protein
MGLFIFLYRAFVSHASSIAERFPDQKAIHQPGPKTVKHLTQMGSLKQGICGNNGILEWWNGGRMKNRRSEARGRQRWVNLRGQRRGWNDGIVE